MEGNNASTNATTLCEQLVDKEKFSLYSLAVAAGIIIILSFFEKRKNLKCRSCGKRPGLLVPANLLDGQTDTLAYAAAFGCTASSCLSLILYDGNSNNIPEQNPQKFPHWAQLFIWMLIVLEVGISYYPIFACLSSQCLVVSSVIGFCYSLIWFLVQLDDVIECQPDSVLFKGEDIVVQLPVFVCLLYLILKFGHTFVMEVYSVIKVKYKKIAESAIMLKAAEWMNSKWMNFCLTKYSDSYKDDKLSNIWLSCMEPLRVVGLAGMKRSMADRHNTNKLAQEYQLKYVRSLLLKQEDFDPRNELDMVRIKNDIKFACSRDPTFKYSPKIIAAFTVAVVCLFEWGFKLLLVFAQMLHLVYDGLETNRELINNSTTFYTQLHLFVDVTTFSGTIAIGLSTFIIAFHVFNIFRSYRDHLRRLYKGDFSKLPKKMWNTPASEIMTYSLHYAGIQIAVLLLGYAVLMLVIYVVGLLVAYFIVLPFLGLVPSDFLQPFFAIVPAKIITVVFFYVQRFICHKTLLDQTKVYNNETGKSHQALALNNRKAYHNISYFMFFFYIILGAYKSFERITKGIFLGTLYLARMDRSALMQGFEDWDNGYMAYISFLRMELTHCHPVLVVFCDLMQKVKDEKQSTYGSCVQILPTSNSSTSLSSTQTDYNYQSEASINAYDKQIQNRWLKCYTLVRNPSLVQLCKRCLCKETECETL